MPKIALSYRRSDSSPIAGRIFDRLAARYGRESVFMDVDNVPYGVDFREHIQNVWRQTDVVVVVIGTQWLGADAAGDKRMDQVADPVRVEIETALALGLPIIPVLADGAKMPPSTALPASFTDFAFFNAAEVSSGRDFHAHLDRLIVALDRTLAARRPGAVPQTTAAGVASDPVPPSWRAHLIGYLIVPLIILLVAHHVIVNAADLNLEYLRAASIVVPFGFGFALLWLGGRDARVATVIGVLLGIVAVSGMTISEGLNSGEPILPQTRFEWRDNIEYAVTISLSFIVGHALASAFRRRMRRLG